MDKYVVNLYPRAYRDLDEIYAYIADTLSDSSVASGIISDLERAIFSLELYPERGAIRRIGTYSSGDYRQLFVKRYVIIYRVFPEKREVRIVTIRYAPSSF